MSPNNETKETELSKLTLVKHSFLLKITFPSEAWEMVNMDLDGHYFLKSFRKFRGSIKQ